MKRPPVLLTQQLIDFLQANGVNTLHQPSKIRMPYMTKLEQPCSLKWLRAEHSFSMGAFSYAVSGYFFACHIARYCSIGEGVQVGRHSHPLDFISTSPIFYLSSRDVLGVSSHPALSESISKPSRIPTSVKPTYIGNDVYIGHEAFILPGVKIGDGAVVGARAVVTKDVPSFSIVAGSPARVVRYRFPQEIIEQLIESCWWQYSPQQLGMIDPANPLLFVERAMRLRQDGVPAYKPETILIGEALATASSVGPA